MIDPLTPIECDLRGLEWMPLYGHRLFTSDFEARASDAAFRAAMRLWWMAWQQVPAASLPDDDAVLCRLAGMGRDMAGWKKIREQSLHGFVLCTDGRLYHKMLAEQALEAWSRRLRDRNRKAAWRAKKYPEDGTETGTGRGQDGDATRTEHGRNADVPADRTGQDRTGQDLRKKERKIHPTDAAKDAAPERNRFWIFGEGLQRFRTMTGLPDGRSRGLLGGWLRDLGDDCGAFRAILIEAEDLAPVEAVAWIAAAVKARTAPAPTPPPADPEYRLKLALKMLDDGKSPSLCRAMVEDFRQSEKLEHAIRTREWIGEDLGIQ